MTYLRSFLAVIGLALILSMGSLVLSPAEATYACGPEPGFFELPTWHKYLPCDAQGNVNIELGEDLNGINSLWLIGVGVLEIILSLAGLIAFAYVIWGGFGYISAQGQPDKAANARKTIINALIGMVIVIMSTIVVQFAIRLLGGEALTSQNGVSLPNPGTGSGTIGRVLTFVYALAAGVAVINIIIGGIKFMLSSGDSSKAGNARNTVIYASVGLVIVLSASIITNTVLNRI